MRKALKLSSNYTQNPKLERYRHASLPVSTDKIKFIFNSYICEIQRYWNRYTTKVKSTILEQLLSYLNMEIQFIRMNPRIMWVQADMGPHLKIGLLRWVRKCTPNIKEDPRLY
jgi:hypothetical protein